MSINNNFLKQKIKNLVLDQSESAVVEEKTILKETLEKMIFFKKFLFFLFRAMIYYFFSISFFIKVTMF